MPATAELEAPTTPPNTRPPTQTKTDQQEPKRPHQGDGEWHMLGMLIAIPVSAWMWFVILWVLGTVIR